MPNLDNQLELNRCPHCSVNNPTLEVRHGFTTDTHNETNQRFWRVYICARCGGVVTAFSNIGYGQHVWEIYPSQTLINDAINEPAKSYLQQTVDSIHAPAGAIMLCASAVDAMLKAKSYNDGNLYPRINQAAEDHLITQGMADWAHQVRLDANAQRHADNDVSLPSGSVGMRVAISGTLIFDELDDGCKHRNRQGHACVACCADDEQRVCRPIQKV